MKLVLWVIMSVLVVGVAKLTIAADDPDGLIMSSVIGGVIGAYLSVIIANVINRCVTRIVHGFIQEIVDMFRR